ncbi:response regulator [Sphaerospermopsis sp. LEGE 08334]|uniref:response regulator n=1 Tax=Sphaerospermopsis sp. LEGE 08334 TaxID=1828651 RepID=UPI001882F4DD|nr:response regulator [Sphaerospermopsis sp. LEGE 08334]MBE9055832.1 response regulator [Sphaerospermopsis sp. LEGE 08334]
MDNTNLEIEQVRSQFSSRERAKKLKILVVDDEPDNLDLLYRTFRRDFNVLKADSGVNALQLLEEEGEVAVIISDQRMPEMKGTEFLSRTLPQFPDTVRIILTGFTDIEDLAEAINAGQVFKYITKPWESGELKEVVQRAAATYDLLKQRTEELRRANTQMQLLTVLVEVTQAASSLEETLAPIAQAFSESFTADGCIVQLTEENTLMATQGVYSKTGVLENWLSQDPLLEAAIATGQIQSCLNIPKDPNLSSLAHYQAAGVQAHLIIPIIYRQQMLGVLSLQWQQPCNLRADELKLIHLSVQLVAIALSSSHSR